MRIAAHLAKTFGSMVATLILVDLLVRLLFPSAPRLNEDFSAPHLQQVIRTSGLDRKLVVIGDSVLWGWRVTADHAAISQLPKYGIAMQNLSFQGSSTVNLYAMLRLLQHDGVRPASILFNVNLKVFNPADSAYRTLYGPLERLSWTLLTPDERTALQQTQANTLDDRFDRWFSSFWMLYGMRADIRETLFGTSDAITALQDVIHSASGEQAREDAAHVPTPDRFLGTYDLEPLTPANVEVAFLIKSAALLSQEKIPAIAVLTPTNHGLLHDYIDVPEYDAQLAYVTQILRRHGVRVLNYDRRFPSSDFLDNDHLTEAGNAKFAADLAGDLRR